jgi:hypothetical protein
MKNSLKKIFGTVLFLFSIGLGLAIILAVFSPIPVEIGGVDLSQTDKEKATMGAILVSALGFLIYKKNSGVI